MIGRIAPTPSGAVHIGNAINFLLTDRLVREQGGILRLRIDDLDPERISDTSVDDIFWALEWLGISIDAGPRDAAEFRASFQHLGRSEYYRTELDQAITFGLPVYYCTCSRSQLTKGSWLNSADWRDHPCRECKQQPDSLHTVRVALNTPLAITMNGAPHNDLYLPDPVVWRRDDLPGYHLSSLIDDRDANINFIVRGNDLFESSLTQLALAPYFNATTFESAEFIHHALITNASGEKLSKSNGSESLRTFAANGGTVTQLIGLAQPS